MLPLELDFAPDSQDLTPTIIEELTFEEEPSVPSQQEAPQEIEIPYEEEIPQEIELPYEEETFQAPETAFDPEVTQQSDELFFQEVPLESQVPFTQDAQDADPSDGLVFPLELEDDYRQEVSPELPVQPVPTEEALTPPQTQELTDQEYRDSKEPAEIVDTPIQKTPPGSVPCGKAAQKSGAVKASGASPTSWPPWCGWC